MATHYSDLSPADRAIFDDKLTTAGNKYGVDPDVLKAIAIQENGPSGGQNPDGTGPAHGVMQIHIERAQDVGYTGDAAGLNNDDTNIEYAARAIAQSQDGDRSHPPADSVDDVFARYNGGMSVHYNGDGTYSNERYVIDAKGHLAKIKQDGGLVGPPDLNIPSPNGRTRANASQATVYRPSQQCVDNIDAEVQAGLHLPLPPNPYHATFWCKINDQFLLTPTRPQYITYFEYIERGVGGMMDEFKIRVFDPRWDVIEDAVGRADPYDTTIDYTSFYIPGWAPMELQFGYVPRNAEQLQTPLDALDLMTPRFRASLTGWAPEFLGWGVEIEIAGKSGLDMTFLQQKARTYNEKTVSDIVTKIAADNDWFPCIEPTTPFTEGNQNKIFTQAQQGAVDFIYNELRPLAQAAGQPDAPKYEVYFDPVPREGKKGTLHFHPPLLSSHPIRRYIYQRQRAGQIISFKPAINPGALAFLKGISNVHTGMNIYNKTHITVPMSDGTTPSKLLNGLVRTPEVFERGNPASRIRTQSQTPYTTPQMVDAQARTQYLGAQMAAFFAELTIIGDPLIRARRCVDVLIFSHTSERVGHPILHWMSGKFYITEARHVIQQGEYTTTLQLVRQDQPSPLTQPEIEMAHGLFETDIDDVHRSLQP